MSREEVAKLFGVIMATYSAFKPTDIEASIDAWVAILLPYDEKMVQNGLLAYLRNDTSGFAPTPGQIIGYISKGVSRAEESPEEAWSKVYKAICRSSYGYIEEFNKLSPTIQNAVGSPERLRDMARDESFNAGVESSNFMRAYRKCVERKEEEARIGVDIFRRLEKLGMPQIGVNNDTE